MSETVDTHNLSALNNYCRTKWMLDYNKGLKALIWANELQAGRQIQVATQTVLHQEKGEATVYSKSFHPASQLGLFYVNDVIQIVQFWLDGAGLCLLVEIQF